MNFDRDVVLTHYFEGRATNDEVAWLEDSIRNDSNFRRLFAEQAALLGLLHEGLRDGAIQNNQVKTNKINSSQKKSNPSRHRRDIGRSASRPWMQRASIAGVIVAVAIVVWYGLQTKPIVSAGSNVISWTGNVTMYRHDKLMALSPDLSLAVGDRIETNQDGHISLQHNDGSHVELAPGTTINMTAPAAMPVMHIEQGRIDINVTTQTNMPPLTILAAQWQINHVGTRFTVTVDSSAKVQVHEGSVAIKQNYLSAVKLFAGQVALVNNKGAPVVSWERPGLSYGTITHPFSATSIWNTPIDLGSAMKALPHDLFTDVKWMTTKSRMVVSKSEGEKIEIKLRSNKQTVLTPALPSSIAKDFSSYHIIIVIDSDNKIIELHEPDRDDGKYYVDKVGTPDLKGDGESQGVLSDNMSAFAGLIREGELETGVHHALSLHFPKAMIQAHNLQIGDRVALPVTYNLSKDAGLLEQQVILALRKYGAIISYSTNVKKPQIAIDSRLSDEIHERVASTMELVAPSLQLISTP